MFKQILDYFVFMIVISANARYNEQIKQARSAMLKINRKTKTFFFSLNAEPACDMGSYFDLRACWDLGDSNHAPDSAQFPAGAPLILSHDGQSYFEEALSFFTSNYVCFPRNETLIE